MQFQKTRNWQTPRILKVVIPAGIVLIILILLFVFPGFLLDSYGVEPLENKNYSIWDDKNIIEQLKPTDRVIERAFAENFLVDFENDEVKKDYQGVITEIIVKKNDEAEQQFVFNLDEQLQWGKYLALTGEKKEFKKWIDMIDEFYLKEKTWSTQLNKFTEVLEETETTWPYDLKYADVLLAAYNREPSKKILKRIEAVMERTLPFFTANELSPNYYSEMERIIYPETSSQAKPTANPELIDPFINAQFIRLSDVNLNVLESFSLLDPDWKEPYEHWSKLIKDSVNNEDVFYPFGIWPDEKDYVPTAMTAFEAITLDTTKVVFQLNKDQQNPSTDSFFNRQLIQTNNLYKSYNIVTLQNMSEEPDIQAMALFGEYLVKDFSDPEEYNKSEYLTAIRTGLSIHQYKDDLSPLNHLFFVQMKEDKLQFSAADQLAVLNSGVIK